MKRVRPGFTLIEMLLAMMLLSVILTVVAVALSGLAGADRQSRVRLDRQRSLQRFVLQFRQDMHEASAWELPSEPPSDDAAVAASPPAPTLQLTGNHGRSMTYHATAQGMVRTVARNAEHLHRERYTWGAPTDVTWAIETTRELPVAVLTLSIDPGPGRAVERHVVRATLLNHQSETPPAE